MATFDIEALEQGITGAMSTSRPQIPDGEYRAVIVDKPPWNLKDYEAPTGKIISGEKDGSPWYAVTYWMEFDEPGNDLVNGRVMGFKCFLDIDEDNGKLSTKEGENARLGQIRAACHQNDAEQPWAMADPIGCAVLARVGPVANKKNPERPYKDIVYVSSVD